MSNETKQFKNQLANLILKGYIQILAKVALIVIVVFILCLFFYPTMMYVPFFQAGMYLATGVQLTKVWLLSSLFFILVQSVEYYNMYQTVKKIDEATDNQQ